MKRGCCEGRSEGRDRRGNAEESGIARTRGDVSAVERGASDQLYAHPSRRSAFAFFMERTRCLAQAIKLKKRVQQFSS